MHRRLSIFGISFSVRLLVASLAGFMLIYSYMLMSALFHRGPFYPFLFGLTYNSMLEHMLHGAFDVDPKIVGNEGFIYGGRTYSYFGILPALLRLPLILFHRLRTTDITLLSCVVATTLAGFFKVRAVIAAALQLEDTRLRSFTFVALMVAIVLGGPQVQFSKPSLTRKPFAGTTPWRRPSSAARFGGSSQSAVSPPVCWPRWRCSPASPSSRGSRPRSASMRRPGCSSCRSPGPSGRAGSQSDTTRLTRPPCHGCGSIARHRSGSRPRWRSCSSSLWPVASSISSGGEIHSSLRRCDRRSCSRPSSPKGWR